MRRFAILTLSMAFLFACNGDTPDVAHDSVDSVRDSADVVKIPVDTLRGDTAATQATVKYDCSVLRRRIPAENETARINRDLVDLSHCGIDSFDFLYVVPNLFPRWLGSSRVQGNDSLTYGDFVKHVKEFKTTEAYAQLHDRVNTLDSLRSVAFDPAKIHTMKPVLGKLGFTQPEWEMFSGFARTYPVPDKGIFTWGDMLDAFEKYSSTAPVN